MQYYNIKVGSQVNPTFSFNNTSISSAVLAFGVDVIGDKLSIDVGDIGVIFDKDEVEYFTPADYDKVMTSDNYEFATNWVAGDLRGLEYGTPVWIYKGDDLRAKMYIKNVERANKTKYTLNLISAIGLLDAQSYVGDLFNGVSFANVVAGIIGGTVGSSQGGTVPITGGIVDCFIENEVASQFVFGHLPITTKREALHQLMFAYNTVLTKDINGDIVFSFLYDTQPTPISDNNIYLGGKVDYSAPASKVELTEHTYEILGDEEEIILFDNTTSGGVTADHTWVYFNNAPIIKSSLNFGTLTQHGYGVNYAIVSGTGIIKGKPYTHVKTLVSRNVITTQEEKVVSVENATLVTMVNSENVADRLMSYYSSKKTVKADIVLTNESCGRLVTFRDPFDVGETNQGYIAKMSINQSNTDKASCEIVTDYIPTGHGNNFQNAVVLSGSGTWQIPSSVLTKENPIIKAVLIGGGSGGGKGGNGETGHNPQATGTASVPNGEGGAGGSAGIGGDGGKIFTQLVDCTGLTSIAYSCGAGGNPAQQGGNTTFGGYSSANGVRSQYGVINLFTSQVYGYKGANGYAGGKGNADGENLVINGVTYYCGANGQPINGRTAYAFGGMGGGACYGKNGNAGTNAYDEYLEPPTDMWITSTGSSGTGASCSITGTNASVYGCGGQGGHGGGGGGGMAGGTIRTRMRVNPPASGGTGSNGGKGGNGCVVVYY